MITETHIFGQKDPEKNGVKDAYPKKVNKMCLLVTLYSFSCTYFIILIVADKHHYEMYHSIKFLLNSFYVYRS